jgi:sigma-B regulation protein RsbU (phosphoserine phosphatase)
MTDLGTIPLNRDAAVREARRKVRQVLQILTADDLLSTRIGSGVSAVGRAMLREGMAPVLRLGLDQRDGSSSFLLVFHDRQPLRVPESVLAVFDDVEAGRAGASDWEVRIRVRLRQWSGMDEHRTAELRAIVQQKSRDELMDELQVKNRELQESFENLQRTTSAKERMESELNIGRDIQMRMLPMDFPAFPLRREFDVYAVLHPAREVGGDFYDFFMIDEDRVCFGIGDVSGKGVPSALFMAMTKTLIKSRASNDFSPASILTHVNDEMAENNESAMFVTIWLGILDLRNGTVTYTNAGHNPPYVRRADGALERLAKRHGPVVGAMEGMVYGEAELTLHAGDAVLLYTDGVTEAMDPGQALYEEQRLVSTLEAGESAVPEDMVRATVDDVWRFQADAEQADDVTVLALAYHGTPEGATRRSFRMTIGADLGEIAQVNTAFDEYADTHDVSSKIRRSMNVVFDELLNNTISYGFEGRDDGEVTIEVELGTDRLSVTLTDNGKPFNPFGTAPPDTQLSVEEREIGGLGIHLVRQMMDEVTYHRRTDRNVVIVAKLLAEDGAPERT